MIKYVFFASPEDYLKVAYGDILEADNVIYKTSYLEKATKIERVLHAFHNFRGLARYVRLPLKRIWYNRYYPEKCQSGVQYVFIFFTPWCKICSEGFLKHLRDRFNGCKTVLFLQDINNAKKLDMTQMKQLFDHIMIFERNYAKECGIEYYPLVYSEGLKDVPMGERDIDLLFVGQAKGRYTLLKQIYTRLSSQGIHCQFYLSNIDEPEDPNNPGIKIVDRVLYEDNIRLLKRTKCVLDIVPPHTNCNTLRASEAMYYNNRIITNNKHIKDEEYYNSDLISVYSSAEDIDIDFFKKPYDAVNYPYKDKISPKAFLKHINEVLDLDPPL